MDKFIKNSARFLPIILTKSAILFKIAFRVFYVATGDLLSDQNNVENLCSFSIVPHDFILDRITQGVAKIFVECHSERSEKFLKERPLTLFRVTDSKGLKNIVA